MELKDGIQDAHDRLLQIYRKADSIDTTGKLSDEIENIIFKLKACVDACEVSQR